MAENFQGNTTSDDQDRDQTIIYEVRLSPASDSVAVVYSFPSYIGNIVHLRRRLPQFLTNDISHGS